MSDILKRQNDVDARARLDQSGQRLQEGKKAKQESAPEKKKKGVGGWGSDGRRTSVFIWPNTSAAEWRQRLKNKKDLIDGDFCSKPLSHPCTWEGGDVRVHVVAPALRAKSERHSGDKSSSCLQTGGPESKQV